MVKGKSKGSDAFEDQLADPRQQNDFLWLQNCLGVCSVESGAF